MNVQIFAPKNISGTITLEGSKSISNRLLIMQALSKNKFNIENLSPSDDTQTLYRLLHADELICDVGAAGTTMRFLASYLAITKGERILTGSERMKQRPIGILADALKSLGADVQYLEKENYPPIKITGRKIKGGNLKIRADVSSQFISSLLMIAPELENGLQLELTGKTSSLPYLIMTLKLMASLGIKYLFENNTITVFTGNYFSEKNIFVEGDWSAASYYFSICALLKKSQIKVKGLFKNSLQGDSILPVIYEQLNVHATFENDMLTLQNKNNHVAQFDYDFSNCPDLAQTVIVTCAALGVEGKFKGLQSLKIKETDRTRALANELKKFDVLFFEQEDVWILKGKINANAQVEIKTYDDHRMAMSFAPLSIICGDVRIANAEVVKKSYPSFWDDLSILGFSFSSFT